MGDGFAMGRPRTHRNRIRQGFRLRVHSSSAEHTRLFRPTFTSQWLMYPELRICSTPTKIPLHPSSDLSTESIQSG